MGEGGKSFLSVEIMSVLEDVTEERKETGRHLRRPCEGPETSDIQETGISNCPWNLDWAGEAMTG